MNGKNLFLGLNYIDRKFIEEAETDTIPAKRLSVRRPLLIAAIIALMLLLVGCGIMYVMKMKDLKLGEQTVTRYSDSIEESIESTEMNLEVLSLQGIKSTPNYMANQEWLQFTQTYTPELGEYWESDEEYWAYSVRDQVMVDKLNEICEKYGLQIIGKPWHEHMDCGAFLELAGVGSLLKEDSEVSIRIPQGRFFLGGSFTIYGNLVFADVDMPLYFTYHCVKKDVFYDVFAYIQADMVEERSYTTEDGISLLLLESEQSGMIMVDREDCFLSLSIDLNNSTSLEEIAEQFDFQIQTSPIDIDAASAREQASIEEVSANDPDKERFVRATYKEYVEDLLWSSGWDTTEIPEREYAFFDLDGNGKQELLILYDGYICSVVGMKNGKTDEGKTYHMILCEDNVLIDKAEFIIGEIRYHIFKFADNGDPVFSNPKERSIVRLLNRNGEWWRTSSTDHYAEFDMQITETEAMEILNSYVPVRLETRSLKQFEEP